MKLPARARNVIQANAERLIATGNGLTIVLMVGLVIFALSRLNTIYETVNAIVKNEHVGIESLYTMQSAARERSLLLYAIVHETDPFRREERIQDFTDLANDFGDARRRFLRLNLSEPERQLLAQQRERTNVTLPLQLRVVELARDGRIRDAERLLNAQVVPAQNAAMATLRELLDHELKESVELGEVAERKRRAAVAWLLSGGGIAVALGLLTGLYVRSRLSKLLARLMETSGDLKTALQDLEYQKLALDQHAIVSIADAGGRISYVNRKFSEVSGYTPAELIGQNHRLLKSGHHPPEFYRQLWATIAGGNVWQGIMCNRAKDGRHYWVDTTIVPFLDAAGRPYQYVSVRTEITRIKEAEALLARSKEELEVRVAERTHALAAANASLQAEITQRRRLEEELRRLAATDPLTGIYNRRRFDELLSAEVHRAVRYRTPLSLIILDIDRFKRINDTLGHATGDLILTRITALVAASIRADDIFARLGGEEFGVLAPNVTLAECRKLAEKLRAAVAQMVVSEAPQVTCSFGATEYHVGEAPDEFVRRADEALYRAKANGRNRVEAA